MINLMNYTDFFVNSAPAILFFPIWAMLMILVNALIPFVSSKRLTLNLTLGATLAGIIFSAFCLLYCLNNPQAVVENNLNWLVADVLHVSFGIYIDNLSAVMALLVCVISFLVQFYSYGYMKEDKSFHRYYVYLNLFNFSMLGLVLASNLVQTYIFWELVGLCSYLLISFWYKKKSATEAAKKAFLVNRIGDVGFLLGIAVLAYFAITFDSAQNIVLLGYSTLQFAAETAYSMISGHTFTLLCLLLLCGAIAKSAQFPLHTWLADAMEAPTPVSALIHSATMVAAGVFLIARLYPIFILSKTAMFVMALVGMITALLCAYIAMSQNDIKKILAYSTSSQIGLMFVGMGVGAYSGAIFHLVIHGISKALLFLCAGCVIKAMNNEHDIKFFGGLRRLMPVCSVAYLIGCLSLSGLFLSGFYSKEMILDKVYDSGNEFLLAGFVLVAFMTAYYLFRSYFLVFEGEKRFDFEIKPVSWMMTVPVVLLAFPAAAFGYIRRFDFPQFIYFITPDPAMHINWVLTVVMLTLALGAVYLAFRLYALPYNVFVLIKEKALNKENLLYKLSYRKFYFDEIYRWVIDNLLLRVCRLLDFVDKYIVDGCVTLMALVTRVFSYVFSKSQTGNVQSYLGYSIVVISLIMLVVGALYVLGSLVGV